MLRVQTSEKTQQRREWKNTLESLEQPQQATSPARHQRLENWRRHWSKSMGKAGRVFFFAPIRLDAVQGKRHETACVLKNVLSLRILREDEYTRHGVFNSSHTDDFTEISSQSGSIESDNPNCSLMFIARENPPERRSERVRISKPIFFCERDGNRSIINHRKMFESDSLDSYTYSCILVFAKLSSLLASRNTLHVSYVVHLIMHFVSYLYFVWFCLIYFTRRLFETSKSALPISWQRCGLGARQGSDNALCRKHNLERSLRQTKDPFTPEDWRMVRNLGPSINYINYLQTYVHLFMCLHTISDISDFRNGHTARQQWCFLLIRVGSRQRRLGEGSWRHPQKRRGIRDQNQKATSLYNIYIHIYIHTYIHYITYITLHTYITYIHTYIYMGGAPPICQLFLVCFYQGVPCVVTHSHITLLDSR